MTYKGAWSSYESKKSSYKGAQMTLEGVIREVVWCMMWKPKSKKGWSKIQPFSKNDNPSQYCILKRHGIFRKLKVFSGGGGNVCSLFYEMEFQASTIPEQI